MSNRAQPPFFFFAGVNGPILYRFIACVPDTVDSDKDTSHAQVSYPGINKPTYQG